MNEEEKESIEEFRKQLRLAINIDDVTTTIRNDNAQTILNLIEKLQKENEELNLKYYMLYTGKIENLKAQEVKIKSQVIPVQKVKDKIEKEIKYHEKNILDIENITMLKGKTVKEEAEIEFNKYAIVVLKKMLQELLEGRK